MSVILPGATAPLISSCPAQLMEELSKCRKAEREAEVALSSLLFGNQPYRTENHIAACDALTAARVATIKKEKEVAAAVFGRAL